MSHDVLVVGAGPAGSTSAALLAEAGLSVVVLDKQSFPRPKIGESLLPVCLPVLERLGIDPGPNFVHKRGAEFVCEATGRHRVIDFADALDGPPRHAWQVDRAGFDVQVRDAARSRGAEVMHGVKVVGVDIEDDEVIVKTRTEGGGIGEAMRARYIIDATGQDRLLARHAQAAETLTGFGQSAAYVHFTGITDEGWADFDPHHDIRIMMVDDGWAWVIPLPQRRMSIGLVKRSGKARELLPAYLSGSPLIRKWTAGAQRSEPTTVRNYSFYNRKASGSRFACVGDAACFLDPVFSSGVSLAMVGAADVASRVIEAFADGREADPELLRDHEDWMHDGYRTFSAVIERFYNTNFVDHFIFGSVDADDTITRGVVSVLAGDVWRSDNQVKAMLLRSRRRRATASAGL